MPCRVGLRNLHGTILLAMRQQKNTSYVNQKVTGFLSVWASAQRNVVGAIKSLNSYRSGL